MQRCSFIGFFVVLVALFVVHTNAALPGIKVALSQAGLNYAQSLGVQYLQKSLNGQTFWLQPQYGSQDGFSYQITGISMFGIYAPDEAIVFAPNTGFTFDLWNVNAQIHAWWVAEEESWPNIKAYGEMQIWITGAGAKTEVHLGLDAKGKPIARASNTQAWLGNVGVDIWGSNLDFIKGLVENMIRDVVYSMGPGELANAINSEINNAFTKMLQRIPTEVKIGTVAELDYSLVADEVVSSSHMMLPLKGETFLQSSHVEAPFTPAAIPDPTGGAAQLQLYVTPYPFNTAMYVYFAAGKLNQVITAADVPSQSPINFNTSSWQAIVPNLYKACPNCVMQMTISPLSYPQFSFSKTIGAQVVVDANLAVQVINSTTRQISTAFVARLDVKADATMAISKNNLTAKITGADVTTTIVSSNIGTFNPTQFQGIVLFVAEGIIMPLANTYLQVGVPVPSMDDISLVNPAISIQDGYLAIDTNLHYTGPV